LSPHGDEGGIDQSAIRTKLLYTVEEAAQLLSLSRTSVFKLIGDQKLVAVKIGGRRRIAHRALEDFVSSLQPVAGAAAGRTVPLSTPCALGAPHVDGVSLSETGI
jgi:excisionase family DNA binding protein